MMGQLLFLSCKQILFLMLMGFCLVFVQQKGFSVILSDMCPSVSGITTKDAALSAELGMRALDLAVGRAASPHPVGDQGERHLNDSNSDPDENGVLKPGGHLVIKLLESEDVKGENFT